MPLSSAGIHGSAEEQGKRCRQLVRNQIPRLIIKGIMLNLVIAPLVHHNFTPVFNPARIVFFISNCKHERILGLPSFNHSQYFEAERGNYRVIETFRWEQKRSQDACAAASFSGRARRIVANSTLLARLHLLSSLLQIIPVNHS